ncbi:MAG: molybdenum cofactor biosynthesis protein MoaB [Thermoguttaceae bacterium]|nr:molybdenum cofactor biosynthesis protein MoaB [Thermoguttaceae bacterium]MDW8036495.1 molybdenum cofactor biosynthesis protein B [Thermoguttaceae bacterium]
MHEVAAEHRQQAPRSVRCAVITVSDTRTLADDLSGQTALEILQAAGHQVVARQIVRDEPAEIRQALESLLTQEAIQMVLLTGGTGLSSRDVTVEVVSPLLTKPLPGFGELFRMLSYQQIGPAAMLSRAIAGLVGRTAIFVLPGSPQAVRLALEKLIVPELGHLIGQAYRTA